MGGGWLGGAPTYGHMYMHTHTCGKHDNFMQMAAPMGESLGIPYDVIQAYACVRVHVCVCACVWGAPSHHPPPTSTQPPPPRGDPRNQSKFNST